LIAYKVVGDDSVDVAYDANGRLVKRTVGGTVQSYFLWFGENLFAELTSSGDDKVQYSYYGMDQLHAVIVDDTVYFAHTDGLGNVIGLVNDAKVLKASYEYNLWGDPDGSVPTENLQGETNRARFSTPPPHPH